MEKNWTSVATNYEYKIVQGGYVATVSDTVASSVMDDPTDNTMVVIPQGSNDGERIGRQIVLKKVIVNVRVTWKEALLDGKIAHNAPVRVILVLDKQNNGSLSLQPDEVLNSLALQEEILAPRNTRYFQRFFLLKDVMIDPPPRTAVNLGIIASTINFPDTAQGVKVQGTFELAGDGDTSGIMPMDGTATSAAWTGNVDMANVATDFDLTATLSDTKVVGTANVTHRQGGVRTQEVTRCFSMEVPMELNVHYLNTDLSGRNYNIMDNALHLMAMTQPQPNLNVELEWNHTTWYLG